MKFEVEVTFDDSVAFLHALARMPPNCDPDPKDGFIRDAIVAVVGGAVIVTLLHQFAQFHFPTALVTTALGGGILWALLSRQFSRSGIDVADGVTLGHHVYHLSETAIDRTSKYHQITMQWSGVRSIYESTDHIYVMLDRGFAFIIPKRCVDVDQLLAILKRKVEVGNLDR